MDKSNKRFFNLLTKTLIVFLILVLPLYVLNIFFIQSLKSGIRHQFVSSLDSNIRFYVNSLEQEMDRMITLKNKTLYDEDILAVSSMAEILTEYERAQAYAHIKNRLALIKDSSLFIQNIAVYITPINRIISTEHFDDRIPPKEALALIEGASSAERPLSGTNDHLFISAIYPTFEQRWYRNQSFVFAVKIELSISELRKSLASINSSGGAGIIDNAGKWSVFPSIKGGSEAEIAIHKAVRSGGPKDVPRNEKLQAGGNSYLVSFINSSVLGATVVTYVPEEAVLGGTSPYSYWFWAVSVFSALVIVAYSLWIFRLIHHPVQRLVRAFRMVEKGQFDMLLKPHFNDEFAYLYQQFNATIKQLQFLIHDNYEQKLRSNQAELKQLQSQINPHFLYNSFFVLYRLIDYEDNDNAKRMARFLGEYFRVITHNTMDDLTLEAELKHALTYAEIQQMRFSEQLSMQWDPIPESCRQVMIPRLVLQPVIENAFEHGLEKHVGQGELRVGLQAEDGIVCIRIENSGSLSFSELGEIERLLQDGGKPVAAEGGFDVHEGEKYGLVNVQKRLQLKFGRRYGLAVSLSELGGLRVEICIPTGEIHVQTVDRG